MCSVLAPNKFATETLELTINVVNSDRLAQTDDMVVTCTEVIPEYLENDVLYGPFDITQSQGVQPFFYQSEYQYSQVICRLSGPSPMPASVAMGHVGVGIDDWFNCRHCGLWLA